VVRTRRYVHNACLMAIPAEHRDLYLAFSRGSTHIAEAIRGLTQGELTRRASNSGWSVRDNLVHLADMELMRAFRIRQVIGEERPALALIDESAWQRRLQYLWRSPEAALAQFEQARFGTCEILAHCGKEGWARIGVHPEEGDLTVTELVRRGVRHVEEHTATISAIRGR
jgi:hypothetical protein